MFHFTNVIPRNWEFKGHYSLEELLGLQIVSQGENSKTVTAGKEKGDPKKRPRILQKYGDEQMRKMWEDRGHGTASPHSQKI